MKIIKSITLFLSGAAVILSSCTKENMIEPNASFQTSFQKEGKMEASAGVPFYVYVDHNNAQFLTLYSGNAGAVYGESGAVGVDFNGSDSLQVTYANPGTYQLTVVASSTGNWAEDFKRTVNTIEVTVIDQRTTFSTFYINSVRTDQIQGVVFDTEVEGEVIDFPGRSYLFTPSFITSAPDAKVYIGSVADENLQVSAQSVVDFSNADTNPIQYIVVAPNGETQTIPVRITKVAASSDTELSFVQSLTPRNEIMDTAEPDANGNIYFIRNNSTDASYKLSISAAYGSTIEIEYNGRWATYRETTRYNLSNVTAIRITAQDTQTQKVYPFYAVDALVTKFVFPLEDVEINGTIDNSARTITFNLSNDFSEKIKNIAANWEGAATSVTVNGVAQEAGVTRNDFSSPLVYTFGVGGAIVDYTVTVNIGQ